MVSTKPIAYVDVVTAPRQVRVIVGEDQPFVREGIVHVLQDGGFDVVGTAADARDLMRMADAYRPDVDRRRHPDAPGSRR